MAEAKERAALLSYRFVSRRTVILLGRRTAAAFGVRSEYFARVQVFGATVVVVPHPSGVNRWFNDPANVARFKRFMRRVVRDGR